MKQPFEFDPIKPAAAKGPEAPGIEGSSFGKLADLAARAAEETSRLTNLEPILRIPVTVQVLLGSATMPVADLMKLGRGAVIPLDHRVGEPVEVDAAKSSSTGELWREAPSLSWKTRIRDSACR